GTTRPSPTARNATRPPTPPRPPRRRSGPLGAPPGRRTARRSWPLLAAPDAGVALEPVVEIVVPARQPCRDARGQVRGDECDPPAFHLADVGLLVVPAAVERPGVVAQDDVAEGHRGEADPPRQPGREPA